MIAAALALALAQAPVEPPDTAIFTAPLTIPAAAIVGLAYGTQAFIGNNNPMVFVPVGVAFRAGEVDWIIDAAFSSVAARLLSAGFPNPGFTGAWLGVGPVLHTGPPGLHGFFFSPKLSACVFRINSDPRSDQLDGLLLTSVTIGFDAGYQVLWGRWYVALVLGVSGGVTANDNDAIAGPWREMDGIRLRTSLQPAIGFNLQALRVGYTF